MWLRCTEADLPPRQVRKTSGELQSDCRASLAIARPLNTWPGRDTTAWTLLGCVSSFKLVLSLNVCFSLILQIFTGKESVLTLQIFICYVSKHVICLSQSLSLTLLV